MSKSNPQLRVLTYHRVDSFSNDRLNDRPELTVSPEQFEMQMRFLANCFNVVSLGQVLESVDGGDSLPDQSVLVTFDDAYSNIGANAWPILRKLDLPVTIFVATAYPSLEKRFFWWDQLRSALSETNVKFLAIPEIGSFKLDDRNQKLRAYKRLRNILKSNSPEKAADILEKIIQKTGEPLMRSEVMDWDEIKALASEGVQFASHTRNHPVLTQIDRVQLEMELSGSAEDLERMTGSSPPAIAYPGGFYNDKVIEIAKSLGYQLGFTTETRNNRLNQQRNLSLGRISISAKYSLSAFRAILMPGGINLIRGYKYVRKLLQSSSGK